MGDRKRSLCLLLAGIVCGGMSSPTVAATPDGPVAVLIATEEQTTRLPAELGRPSGVTIDFETGEVIISGETRTLELHNRLDQTISSTPVPTDLPVVGIAGRGRLLALDDENVVVVDERGRKVDTVDEFDAGTHFSVDAVDGSVLALHPERNQIEIVTPDGSVTTRPLPRLSSDVVPAAHPGTDDVYVVESSGLAIVDPEGIIAARYEFSDLEPRIPVAANFGPSADPTDDPQELSLYVVTESDGSSPYLLHEVTLVQPSAVVTEPATLIKTTALSALDPPSPDPAGITYLSDRSRLLVGDSEVDEMKIYQGTNLFELRLGGSLFDTGTTVGWSDEPTGVSYSPTSHQLYVSDDGGSGRIHIVNSGSDSRYGTGDDSVSQLNLGKFTHSVDSEGVAYHPATGALFVADGVGKEVWRISPGPNGVFEPGGTVGDDTATHFDIEVHGAADPEGIAVDPNTGRLLVVDRHSELVFVVTTTGSLVRIIDLAAANPVSPAGVVLAPASNGSGVLHMYIVARGIDNGANPNENDGKMYEMAAGFGSAPPSGAPTANGDVASTNEDTKVTINVLANDTDVDGDPLTVTSLTQPANGTAVVNPNQTVTYIPAANFNGTTSFTYRANDGTANSNIATVTITVNPVNDPPTASNDTATTTTDTAISINVLANDTDVDGDPLTVTSLTQPANGTATLNPNQTVTYTPPAGFNGTTAFTYRANDGTTNSNIATVTITVAETPPLVQSSLSESTVAGSVSSGDHFSTHTEDGAFEVLTETHTGGSPTTRVSLLDHQWILEIQRGETVTLHLRAHRSNNSEGDNFVFEYSADGGSSFTPALTVSSATTTSMTAALPTTISGELIVRVRDTDQIVGNGSLDSVSVDYLAVVTESPLPALPVVTVVATDSAAGEPSNPGQFTITRSSTAGTLDVSYTLAGTATNGSDYSSLSGSVSFANGQSAATVTVAPINDTVPEGTETVILTLSDSTTYVVGSPSADTVIIADNDQPTLEAFASSDSHNYGIVTGTLTDTRFDDGNYQAITEERHAGGNRTRLQHQWVFDVTGGSTVEFHLQAFRSGSEAFDFSYSLDGQNWVQMVSVLATADGTDLTYTLPAGVNGTIYVRVTDRDRNKGDSATDTITIDRMFFRTYP